MSHEEEGRSLMIIPEDEPERTLTDADLDAITERLSMHSCRFEGVKREEFMEMINFYRGFNKSWTDSKNTVRRLLLTFAVAVLLALVTEGFWSRMISRIRGVPLN